MKRFILYNFIAFTLLSCGNPSGQFRLTGEFEHLQQGEFYLYCPEGALTGIDTINLENGKFDYTTSIKGKTTLYLLYPNFTEQAIFAANGMHVKIKGDAQKLGETEISGSDENDQLTKFRLKHLNSSLSEQLKDATAFIIENPQSLVSTFLFQKYYIDASSTDTTGLIQAYQALYKNQPKSPQVIKWKSVVESKTKGVSIDNFSQLKFISAEKDTVTTVKFKGKPLLITIWANWLNSSYQNYQTKKLWTKYQDSIQILSISLDLSQAELKEGIRRNNITWPVFCDYEGWDNSVLDKLALKEIPYAFLFDKEQNLIVSGNKIAEDITPTLEKIIHSE